MKIETLNTPAQPQVHGAKAEPQLSARERAIQALMKPASQPTPVPNPSQISPEEMSAVRTPSQPVEGQNYNTGDGTPEAKAESKVSDEPISSQYAILARREKALRQRERDIRAKEEAIKAQNRPVESPKPVFDESKYVSREKLLDDTFGVLNELGLGYDKLTEKVLNSPSPENLQFMQEIKTLKAELQAIRGETESNKKSFEQQQVEQKTQAINQIRSEVSHLVKHDPTFETVKATNSINDVVALIEKTFDEDGYLMSVEDAAREVEEYLVEEAIRLARLSKIQQRLAPKPQAEAPKATAPQQQSIQTLTNSVASSRQLSAKERAVLAFQGKLQK